MKYIFKCIVNYIKGTDKVLIALCICVSSLSVVLLSGIENSNMLASPRQITVQAAASIIGLIIAIILSKIDYKMMAKLWKFHSTFAYGLVILTFFIGIRVSDFVDDRAWLQLPFGMTLQPSELLKISFIVTFAFHLEKVGNKINNIKYLLGLILHALIPIGLIMKQGDHGTALIFAFIFAFMLFSAGLSWKYIVPAIILVICSLPILWNIIGEDKQMRIMTIFNQCLTHWELDGNKIWE